MTQAGGATEIDVEDQPLILEVIVDVAELVGDQDRRGAPELGVGLVAVDVGGHGSVTPGEELDGFVGPLHGVDTAVGRTPGVGMVRSDSAAVVVPKSAVVVAVGMGYCRGLAVVAQVAWSDF